MSDMYTERLLDHYRHPRNKGRLESPDLHAEEYNPLCGDRVRIEMLDRDGRSLFGAIEQVVEAA